MVTPNIGRNAEKQDESYTLLVGIQNCTVEKSIDETKHVLII